MIRSFAWSTSVLTILALGVALLSIGGDVPVAVEI